MHDPIIDVLGTCLSGNEFELLRRSMPEEPRQQGVLTATAHRSFSIGLSRGQKTNAALSPLRVQFGRGA